MNRPRYGSSVVVLPGSGAAAHAGGAPIGRPTNRRLPPARRPCLARPTPFTVTSTDAGTNLVLSWVDSGANWYYHIYHGTTPDFVPTESNRLATIHAENTTGTLSWSNSWALLVNGDLYFLVRAQGCGGDTVDAPRIAVTKTPPLLPGALFGGNHDGEATYYWEADGGGNCMFPPTPE
jgi:hypothetical protein